MNSHAVADAMVRSKSLALPRSRDSQASGRARASSGGGKANVRQALFVPALVAARFNPDFKAKYAQLVKAGKPAKIAITAVMRKLIGTANALLKADRCWQKSSA